MTGISIIGGIYLAFCLGLAVYLLLQVGITNAAKIMGGLTGIGVLIVLLLEVMGFGNYGYSHQNFLYNDVINIGMAFAAPFFGLVVIGLAWLAK